MDVQKSSHSIHRQDEGQGGGGESRVALSLTPEDKNNVKAVLEVEPAGVRSSASNWSSQQRLTYSWKDINVWTGTPPTKQAQGGAGEAVTAIRHDVEKA